MRFIHYVYDVCDIIQRKSLKSLSHVYRLPTCAGGMSYSLYLNITFLCVYLYRGMIVGRERQGSGQAAAFIGTFLGTMGAGLLLSVLLTTSHTTISH